MFVREIPVTPRVAPAPRVPNSMCANVFEFRNTPFRKKTNRGFSTPLLSKSGKNEVARASHSNDARRCKLRDYNKEQKKRNTIACVRVRSRTSRGNLFHRARRTSTSGLATTRQFQDRARQRTDQRAGCYPQNDIAQERTQCQANACAQHYHNQNTSEQRRKRLCATCHVGIETQGA